MTDRLKELRTVSSLGPQGPAAPPPPPSSNDPFAAFWTRYNGIQSKISEIDQGIQEISSLDDDIQSCTNQEEADTKRGELQEKMRQTTLGAESIRQELEKLRQEIDNLSDEYPGSAEVRLQKNHLHVLNNDFAQLINRFTKMQEEVKAKFARQVVRHYAIAGVNLDANSVQRIIQENPDALRQNAFQITGGAKTAEAAQIYNEIAARHQDIMDIDRMLNELLDLFVQFSIVVKDQGRMIDNIEQNIASASDYVARGVEQLELAKKDQKSGRKCLWWILILVVLVLAAVVAIIIVKTKS